MLELTAAQSLIARITAIGLASAVFTYYLVKPFIDIRLANNPFRQFATNAIKGTIGILGSIALQIIAGAFLPAVGLWFKLPDSYNQGSKKMHNTLSRSSSQRYTL